MPASETPVSELVKEARSRLGLSQEKLAGALKVSFPTVNRWENAKTSPDARSLRALAALLRPRGPEFANLADRISPPDTEQTGSEEPKRRRRGRAAPVGRAVLDTKSMETMLWDAACSIRGEKDAPKFKDYILPLLFIKRLSDVFDDEIARLVETYDGDEELTRTVVEADHGLLRFYLPEPARWAVISGRQPMEWPEGKRPKTVGEQLTSAIRAITKANPSLQGVIDIVDYNETRNGEREISDAALSKLIEQFSDPRYRLGLSDVEPDFLGRAYEYLLRKFAEGQGQSAGEFFTPKEVGWLIAYLMKPQQGDEVYDFACGSGGLLIKCELALHERERDVKRPLRLSGQELTGSSFAIARMNMVLHDMEGEIVRGNTMTNPKFLDGSRLKRFDIVVSNPMWNQDNIDPALYESDPYERFSAGYAPSSSADWAWLQHAVASLKDTGRAAVVLDTGAVSRGSGNQSENKEKAIRQLFVEKDWVEAVILLPENLFYNTPAAGIVVVLNLQKSTTRKESVILINADSQFRKGRPKNFLPEESIKLIAAAFHAGREVEKLVRVVSTEELAKNDFNLSPSRYIETGEARQYRDLQSLLDELHSMDETAAGLDRELFRVFNALGYRIPTGL